MRSVVFQAELKFTFKAAALSLSSETEADDALPSGLSRFAQSEPTAPGESRHCSALPATLGICPRSHSQEKHGMDAAPITTEQNQGICAQIFPRESSSAPTPRAEDGEQRAAPFQHPLGIPSDHRTSVINSIIGFFFC